VHEFNDQRPRGMTQMYPQMYPPGNFSGPN